MESRKQARERVMAQKGGENEERGREGV